MAETGEIIAGTASLGLYAGAVGGAIGGAVGGGFAAAAVWPSIIAGVHGAGGKVLGVIAGLFLFGGCASVGSLAGALGCCCVCGVGGTCCSFFSNNKERSNADDIERAPKRSLYQQI